MVAARRFLRRQRCRRDPAAVRAAVLIRMVVVGYIPRDGDRHVFNMRKANEREQARIAPLLGL